ncbi:MAG: response regulator transcription factor [bacterium]|nr:response regulator transcription factor [bacterium]
MRIIVIEDDKKIAAFIKKGLEEEHYAADVFHDGKEGVYWATVNDYDLIILDIMLPGKDGIKICDEIRRKHILTPILMLTAKASVSDRVKGLDSGADDYLTKPFAFEELFARVRSLLRRNQSYKTKTLNIADLELDPASRTVTRAGEKIALTGKEYALLEYMMRNKGRVLTEHMILDHTWNMDYDPESNIVNVYVHHLREKVDKGYDKKLIHTLRSRGFTIKDDDEDI